MPSDSIEVRWFVRIDEARRDAIAKTLGKLDARCDRYLFIEGADDFGVKLRGGDAGDPEFKGRTAVLGTQVMDGAIGVVETWMKWSYANEKKLAIDEKRSTLVAKERHLEKCVFDPKTKAWQKTEQDRPPKAANLEITLVRVDGVDWVTVGAEAFPTDRETVSAFGKLGPHLARLAGIAGIELTAEASLSYPAWLAKHHAK